MKIEIEEIKQESQEHKLLVQFYKEFSLKIMFNKIDEFNNPYQKIYYGTITKHYLNYSDRIQYDDDNVPERLKIAVEQMVKFL